MTILHMHTDDDRIISVQADAIVAISTSECRNTTGDRLTTLHLSSGGTLDVNEDYESVEHRWSRATGQKVDE